MTPIETKPCEYCAGTGRVDVFTRCPRCDGEGTPPASGRSWRKEAEYWHKAYAEILKDAQDAGLYPTFHVVGVFPPEEEP